MNLIIYLTAILLYSQHCLGADTVDKNIEIANIDRSVDLTSQVVKNVYKITFENKGSAPVASVLFAVEEDLARVSFIRATSESKTVLKVSPTKIQGKDGKPAWRINLRENLQPKKRVTIEVEVDLTESLTPFPATIIQKEKQLVLYNGNLYFYSPYTVVKQAATFNLGTKKIENYTKAKGVTQKDEGLTVGPYENIGPFTEEVLSVHYENNSPFLVVVDLLRVLEVSNWGNVAVEETLVLENKGALLKGSFSRYEFQRDSQSGLSSVKTFKTILPAAAKDVYYRDDIGNISTSHLRPLEDSVELDLRPRFPLFGGWKTKYTTGYNVPSYEYLRSSGENFILKMRLIDHIFDNMVVQKVTTKIILPEGAQNIAISTPYPVTRLPDEKHFTYLDTIGRPVIVVQGANLVENHIQDFKLNYTFPRILMLQEPLLIVAAFFILFLSSIVYVRLDFSIAKSKDE